MTLKNIALTYLRRKKGKAAFVLAGLMTGVATVVALMSLSSALTNEINDKLEKYGANILIMPKSDQLSLAYEGLSLGGFSFSTREILQTDLENIRTIENAANIAAIDPLVLGTVQVNGTNVLLAGREFASKAAIKPWWRINGSIPKPDEIVPGSEAARILNLVKGQTVEIGNRSLMVSGILESTGSQDDSLIFTHLTTAQEMLGKKGNVSMVEVAALCKDCPVEDMVGQISAVLPNAKVTAIQSVVKGRMETIGHFKNFSFGVSALVVLVGALVVIVTMMSSVKERTREIGIFRAIGFRRGHIVRIIITEATIISLAAGVLGYLAGICAGNFSLPLFAEGSSAQFAVDPILAVAAVFLALLVGVGVQHLSGVFGRATRSLRCLENTLKKEKPPWNI